MAMSLLTDAHARSALKYLEHHRGCYKPYLTTRKLRLREGNLPKIIEVVKLEPEFKIRL